MPTTHSQTAASLPQGNGPRACILFDKWAFSKLARELPDSVKTDDARASVEPVRLGDVLGPLASGFDSTLSEMTAIEACWTISNGRGPTKYFDSFHKDHDHALRAFLRAALNRGHIDITRAEANDFSTPAKVAGEYHDLINTSYEVPNAAGPGNVRLKRVVALQHNIRAVNGWADEATLTLAQRLAGQGRTVIVVAENLRLREALNQSLAGNGSSRQNMSVFGMVGFYEALKARPEILSSVGVSASYGPYQFMRQWNSHRIAENNLSENTRQFVRLIKGMSMPQTSGEASPANDTDIQPPPRSGRKSFADRYGALPISKPG